MSNGVSKIFLLQISEWQVYEEMKKAGVEYILVDYWKRYPKEAFDEWYRNQNLMHALEVCEDDRLKLALNLAFSCSLRMGEMLGLTWGCVDISEEAIAESRAFIYVDKEVQQVDKAAIQELRGKDVILVFPEESKKQDRSCVEITKDREQYP